MNLSELMVRIGADATSFTRETDRVAARVKKLAQDVQSVGSTLSTALTLPLLAAGGAAIKSATDMDSLKRGLKAVTTESGPLENQLQRLQEVAKLPGLGFREAVQGSINLQAAGFSAAQSERSLRAFGNALATVGKGKADLDGVILALGQIASKGKVSAEEINQLAERVPQIRRVIDAAFGPGMGAASADQWKKMGISSEQFVSKVTDELLKLKQVTDGARNEFENFSDAVEIAMGKAGNILLPFASSALNAVTPVIETVGTLADAFRKLPQPVQDASVKIGILAAAAGPVTYAAGALAEKVTVLSTVMARFGGLARVVASLITPVTVALAAVWYHAEGMIKMWQGLKKEWGEDKFLLRLRDRWKEMEDSINSMVDKMGPVVPAMGLIKGATAGTTEESKKLAKAFDDLGLKSSGELATALQNAKASLATIQAAFDKGSASAMDLRNAKLAVAKATQDLAAQQVKLTKAHQETATSAELLQRAFGKFEGTENFWKRLHGNLQPIKSVIDDLTFRSELLRKSMEAIGQVKPVFLGSGDIDQKKAIEGTVMEAAEIARRAGFKTKNELQQISDQAAANYLRMQELQRQDKATTMDVKNAYDAWKKAAMEAGGMAETSAEKSIKSMTKLQQAVSKQVSTITTDLSRGLAKVITDGGNLSEVFRKVGTDIAEAIIRSGIENWIGRLTKNIDVLIAKLGTFGNALAKVLGMDTTSAKTPATFPGGSSAGTQNMGWPTGSTGSSPDVSRGGSGGSSLGSGLSGWISAGAGVVDAISSVVGNFQMAHMNTALGRIEESTRYAKAYLLTLIEEAYKYWPRLLNIEAGTYGLNDIRLPIFQLRDTIVEGRTGGSPVQFTLDGRVLAQALMPYLSRQVQVGVG